MSLGAYRTGLVTLTKELSLRWAQTKEHWRDARSEEFEKRYLEELLASVDKTTAVIEELDKLLTKVRNDCE
jgi:hypothetical protein